jgi:hypothetical protein
MSFTKKFQMDHRLKDKMQNSKILGYDTDIGLGWELGNLTAENVV